MYWVTAVCVFLACSYFELHAVSILGKKPHKIALEKRPHKIALFCKRALAIEGAYYW